MQFSLSVLIAALSLCCCIGLTLCDEPTPTYEVDSLFTTLSADELEGDVAQAADNEVEKFLNNTRSTFILALKNLSSYLPINVGYVETRAKECDVIRYNKQFYNRVPLIIAAVLIVLGIIFTFLGEFATSPYCN